MQPPAPPLAAPPIAGPTANPIADPLVTPSEWASLYRVAGGAAHHAYAPYSRFYVGAAVLVAVPQNPPSGGSPAQSRDHPADRQIVSGCNVENVSFRLTTCAEQTAIAAAVARFGPRIRVLAVAIHTLNETACAPCGACRQTIAEFAGADCPVHHPGTAGLTATTLGELLPAAFESTSLYAAAAPAAPPSQEPA